MTGSEAVASEVGASSELDPSVCLPTTHDRMDGCAIFYLRRNESTNVCAQ